ncbi:MULTISPECIES: hypothetical protein [unclassified Variovorax]|uniref:hypothetical protein n=1 Tax=unclassified Variovorax TaxID=663243 RepID=UPI000837FB09|nr:MULTISPECIES: hypothetical protein [unclassified Variovorax]PNG56543.1 hypothetical protein CHC07_02962 [Variovorax sp. B4]PNG57967.1 hypothetical protein CHC06_02965 [Variovorax sp. B2]VTV09560.1 hypothetical protein WDL1CHR_00661 [Variovorax sp. WDL1]
MQDTQPGDLPRLSKVIDLKLPLNWLLTVAFSLALLIGGMYFKLGQLGEDMTDLKISVKAGNGQAATIQGELAILKFRIENLEADKRAAK